MKNKDEIKLIIEGINIGGNRGHILGSGADGCSFFVPSPCGLTSGENDGTRENSAFLYCILSYNRTWEHVSVHVGDFENKQQRVPVWAEMCVIKDIAWNDNEWVVQYHPAKDSYKNEHPHVLHLWKPLRSPMPKPPIDYV